MNWPYIRDLSKHIPPSLCGCSGGRRGGGEEQGGEAHSPKVSFTFP